MPLTAEEIAEQAEELMKQWRRQKNAVSRETAIRQGQQLSQQLSILLAQTEQTNQALSTDIGEYNKKIPQLMDAAEQIQQQRPQ